MRRWLVIATVLMIRVGPAWGQEETGPQGEPLKEKTVQQDDVVIVYSYFEKGGADSSVEVRHGAYKKYSTGGIILEQGAFYDGSKSGEWIYYDPQGVRTQTDQYIKGKKRKTRVYTDGTPSKRFESVAITGSIFKFSPDGHFDTLSPKVGFGVAYEIPLPYGYQSDVGFYLAPSISEPVQGSQKADVAFMVYYGLFGSSSLGLGYEFWDSSKGFSTQDSDERFFFTLGWEFQP